MKGIIIFEDSNPTLKNVYCINLTNSDIRMDLCSEETYTLTGIRNNMRSARCNKEDTYDFETGALIALMKMCGREKALKAVEELYSLKEPRGADLDGDVLESKIEYMDKEIKRLTNVSEGFYKFNCRLIDENETLKKEKEQIIVARNILYNKLKEENEKLREKNKYKYLDSFSVVRRNGKQYESLVELFKKLDQKKVDAAYKEAYNTTLPVWQKEALRQAYEIRKESKEKIELPRTLDINGTVYRKSIQIRDFGEEINKLTVDSLIEQNRAFTRKCVDEWIKPPTKREEMWSEIFKLHKKDDVIIKVKREDINTFFHELENKIPEITWASGVKIFEAKGTIDDIYTALKTCDEIYFRLSKETTLSYSSDPEIYQYKDLKHIDYLPPMRWDLFKKGRIVVACTEEEVPEFREKVKRELGNIRIEKYSVENLHCNGPIKVYYHYDKNINWLKPLLVSGISRVKVNNHKVVYWEDVR